MQWNRGRDRLSMLFWSGIVHVLRLRCISRIILLRSMHIHRFPLLRIRVPLLQLLILRLPWLLLPVPLLSVLIRIVRVLLAIVSCVISIEVTTEERTETFVRCILDRGLH